MVGMRAYEIVFGISSILFFAMVFATELMRRQVHTSRYGNQRISPWDHRYVNSLLGQHGIFSFHKQLYERSCLRTCFLVLSAAFLASCAVGASLYLYARTF